jgi:ribose transport system substrate-binding protein
MQHGGKKMVSLTSLKLAPLCVLLCGTVLAPAVSAAEFEASRQGGTPGALLPEELALWSYNTETSAFEVVSGDASAPYALNLRALPEGSRVGFAEGWAAIPFSYAINQRLYELADELGFEVVYCDNDFKAEKAVSCAELIALQGVDVVIESNWHSGAAAPVMNIFDEAGIPVMSLDVLHPNAIFLGADNYVSGLIGGQAAAEHAKALGRCDDVSVLLGIAPADGDAANQRLSGFADGVQTVCGALPEDRIHEDLIDAGTTDQALTKTTDWLTGHPGAGFVLATAIDDPRAFGMSNALAQAGREGVAIGLGCDDVGVAATRTPVEDNNFLGCVAYYPEKYPDWALSVAADILEGKAVPQEVHLEHVFLSAGSINDVYPK